MNNSYAIALVHAWLVDNPEHYSTWVAPYTQLRYAPPHWNAVLVGGHFRRRVAYKSLLPSLACVCKFERLSTRRT